MSKQEKRKPIRISVDEAKKRYDENDVTILDVVDPGTYEELTYRIQDAVRIDPRQIDEEFERLPPERMVLAYCTWPNEETSASVALFLRKQGYDAYAITGGLNTWREADYPIEEKEK